MSFTKEECQALKNNGQCIQCFKDNHNGKMRCDWCIERNRLSRKVKRFKRKLEGKCTECSEQVRDGYTLCDGCRSIRTNKKELDKNVAS